MMLCNCGQICLSNTAGSVCESTPYHHTIILHYKMSRHRWIMEERLKPLWSQILDRPLSDIDSNSHFFKIGGDSVAAIRLVALASNSSILLDVETTFMYPTITAMASKCTLVSDGQDGIGYQNRTTAIAALNHRNLLQAWDTVDICLKSCGLQRKEVDDIMPCTEIQKDMMTSHVESGTWLFQCVFKIEGPNVQRAQNAFEDLRRRNPALRTRIVKHNGDMLQVVTNEDISWRKEKLQLHIYKQSDIAKHMKFGGPLARYAIVQDGQETYLVWTLLHSIFDRWTKILIFEELRKLFQDPKASSENAGGPAFRNFVEFVGNQDRIKAMNFWKNYLDGLEHFDHIYETNESHGQVTNAQMTKLIDFKKPQNTHITFSTITHVAWALTLGNLSRSDDIFFVAVRTGRQLPLAKVDAIIGPTFSYVPVRIRLDPKQPLRILLQTVQEEIISTTPYEPFGAEYAKRHFGGTKYLQSVLMPQPVEPEVFSSPIKSGDTTLLPCENLYTQTRANNGLSLSLVPNGGKLKLWARYDSQLISEGKMASILTEYINNVQIVISALEEPSVGDVWHGEIGSHSSSRNTEKAISKSSKTLATCLKTRSRTLLR
jgi:hypothetical protein